MQLHFIIFAKVACAIVKILMTSQVKLVSAILKKIHNSSIELQLLNVVLLIIFNLMKQFINKTNPHVGVTAQPICNASVFNAIKLV